MCFYVFVVVVTLHMHTQETYIYICFDYIIKSRRFNPTTPRMIHRMHAILTGSAFSPNQRIMTADTNAVPQADQTAYAIDTSIWGKDVANANKLFQKLGLTKQGQKSKRVDCVSVCHFGNMVPKFCRTTSCANTNSPHLSLSGSSSHVVGPRLSPCHVHAHGQCQFGG